MSAPPPLRTLPLLPLLFLLIAPGVINCQLLQGHGPEESEADEQALRPSLLMPSPCNATTVGDCARLASRANQPLLTGIVAFFSLLLLAMICSMALPRTTQNRLLRFLVCACRRKRGKFSYVDVGLYKTRHSMYRKEVYVRHVWGNNRGGKRKGSSGSHAASAIGRLSLVQGRLSVAENGSARRYSRSLLPPTVAVVRVVADEFANSAATVSDMPCGSGYCCFRSDPNIWRTVHPALLVTPASSSVNPGCGGVSYGGPSDPEMQTEEAF